MNKQPGHMLLREAMPLWTSGVVPAQERAALRQGAGDRAGDESLTEEQRCELLARSRAGEHIELTISCTPFLQRPDTPNRNCLRFRDGALRVFGKSGADTVFLRDHRQNDLTARGGTVRTSRMEKGDDGVYRLIQDIRLHEPWAVQMALSGSLDRFSIGWIPTGPVLCSVCKSEVLDDCWHWPGDVVKHNESQSTVEWIFTAAELIETSAVCVPAVTGTSIDDMRAALSAVRQQPSSRLARSHGMKRVCDVLGISAQDGAGEDAVVAAITALQRRVDDAETRLAAVSAQCDEASAALTRERAEHQELRRTLDRQDEDRFIAGGIEAGKVRPGGKLESALRTMFQRDREAAAEMLEGAPVVTPVGAPRQSDAPPPDDPAGIPAAVELQLRSAGIAEPAQYFHKYGTPIRSLH